MKWRDWRAPKKILPVGHSRACPLSGHSSRSTEFPSGVCGVKRDWCEMGAPLDSAPAPTAPLAPAQLICVARALLDFGTRCLLRGAAARCFDPVEANEGRGVAWCQTGVNEGPKRRGATVRRASGTSARKVLGLANILPTSHASLSCSRSGAEVVEHFKAMPDRHGPIQVRPSTGPRHVLFDAERKSIGGKRHGQGGGA